MSHSEYSKCRMSSYGLNATMQTPVSLNGIVNNALLNISPNINQTLPQIVHIHDHLCLDSQSLMPQIW